MGCYTAIDDSIKTYVESGCFKHLGSSDNYNYNRHMDVRDKDHAVSEDTIRQVLSEALYGTESMAVKQLTKSVLRVS